MRLWLLPTLAVSGVIEHIALDKGLDMVDKAAVGGKKWICQKWLSNEANKQTCYIEFLEVEVGTEANRIFADFEAQ